MDGTELARSGSAMKMLWQTETGHLVCRWAEAGKRAPYSPPWIPDDPRAISTRNIASSVVDFTRVSPFGGRHWYALDRLRQISR
jgi:hypothetical protein